MPSTIKSQLAALFFAALFPFCQSSAQPDARPTDAGQEVAPLAAPEPTEADVLNPYRQSIQRVDPMDTTGLDYGLANVLRNYYRKNFTSTENWERAESIRFDGILQLPQGSVRFTAFKKKPDLCKVVLHAANGGRIVMAYDGEDAWQLNTSQSSRADSIPQQTPPATPSSPAPNAPEKSDLIHHSSAISMPSKEALNFIRDATTGGHLLYPLARGKRLELVGVATVQGERCYEIKVTLPDGQVIRSMLDMTDFAERRQITINNITGDEEVNTHSDFRDIDGVRVPFTSTLTIDGEQIHQSRLYHVETNIGVMPWMFSRPSGDNVPGAAVSAGASLMKPTAPLAGGTSSVPSIGEPANDSIFASPMPPAQSGPVTPYRREGGFQIDPDLLAPLDIEALLKETAPGKPR